MTLGPFQTNLSLTWRHWPFVWLGHTISVLWPHSAVSDPADVEDLLQEIMLRSYRHLGGLKESRSIKAWLFQVANNAIIDFYRARGRQPVLREEDLWYGDEAVGASQTLAQCVEPFIAALPASTAELLRAVDLEGYSQKALAAQQGISYSTLKSRVHKARADLRGLFDDCCHLTLDCDGNVAEFEPKDDFCKKC